MLQSVAGNVLVAWLELPASANALQVGYTLVWSAVPVLSLLGAVEMLTHSRKDLPTATRNTKSAKASQPVASRSRSSAPRTAEATA